MDAASVNQMAIPKRDGFCFKLKKNCQAIGRAIKMREIYLLIIFIISRALTVPKFDEFTYFFLLNVIGISKLMFAILVLIGNVSGIIGALIYKSFFRNIEVRWMVFWSMVVKSLEYFANWL